MEIGTMKLTSRNILNGTILELATNEYAATENNAAAPLLTVDQLIRAIQVLAATPDEAEALIAQIKLPTPKDCRAVLAQRALQPIVD
jgi:hypothetical protein